MRLTRTAAIACAVFLAASVGGSGAGLSWQALAQDKLPKQPAADEPAPEPVPEPTPIPEPENPKAPSPDEGTAASEPETAPIEEAERPPNFVEMDAAAPSETAAAEPAPLTGDAPASQDLMAAIATVQSQLEEGFEPGEAEAFRDLVASDPEGATVIGQMLYMRRHFARAAWFFAEAARENPDDASALNNFGVLLDETYMHDPEGKPTSWITTAFDAVARAGALRPDDPAIGNNIGRGAYNVWRTIPEAADLEAAAAALEAAVRGDPVNSVFLSNQALVLDALGDSEGAAAALSMAHLRNPTHPSLRRAAAAVSADTAGAYAGAPRNYCAVDYECARLCPRSIVGQINRVTCEMEQSSAQMACGAGQPYPARFNCAEEIPEFGILIPGLNSGFTISTPWGSIAAVVDGAGNVQWRVELGPNMGALNPYVRADGGYQPDGGWSVSDTRAGVKINLVNNTPAGQTAGEWGYQPVYIQGETSSAEETSELSVGAYGNATIWH